MISRFATRFGPPRDELAAGVTTLVGFALIVAFAVLRLAQTAPIEP